MVEQKTVEPSTYPWIVSKLRKEIRTENRKQLSCSLCAREGSKSPPGGVKVRVEGWIRVLSRLMDG